jgi:hypothetical protein
MSFDAFNILLELLHPAITCNIIKSLSWANAIFPELVLASGLQWLAGGNYLDQQDVHGFSRSSYYRVQDVFLDAVLNCDALAIKFPDTAEKLELVWMWFEAKSTN